MSKLVFNPLSGNFDTVNDKAEEIKYSPSTPADWQTVPADVADGLDYLKSQMTDSQELVKEPTGFPNRTDTAISFDDISRTFEIAPTGASFDVYVKGKKFTKTTESIVISNDDGNHYIYFDPSGVLTETTAFSPSIFENNALVSIVYWNSSTSSRSYFAEERHGLVMDGATHGYLHTVFGARYLSGLALQGFSVDGNGTLNSQAQFQADAGSIRDEDILISLPLTNNIPILYRQGTLWRKKAADAYPVIYNGTAGYTGTNIAYNQLVGASWQLTEVINNNFVLVHVFATNDIDNPFVGILGINSYANIPEARAGAESEISSLSGLPFAEFVAVGTVIFETNSAYTNVPKAIVRSASAGENYVDFRGEQLYTPSGVATSHSLLSNLSSDDHLQYFNEARGDARYVRNGASLGLGEAVFAQKTGTNLEFKSLVAGTNVTLTPSADTITISSSGGTSLDYAVSYLSGNGSQTSFTTIDPVVAERMSVYINGVYQFKNTYSISGTSLVFSEAPSAGTNNIEIVVSQVQTNPSALADATSTIKGAVRLAGDLGGTALNPTVKKYIEVLNAPVVFGTSNITSLLGATYLYAPANFTITKVEVQLFTKGTATTGTLEIDVLKATNLQGSPVDYVSIMTTKPSMNMATATDYQISTGVIDPAQSSITEGQFVRLDITSRPANLQSIHVRVYGF